MIPVYNVLVYVLIKIFRHSQFNLDNPSQITLFIIIDLVSNTDISPINININFTKSSNISSSINEIYFSLLVTHTNFTINNQSISIYSPFNIPVLYWTNLQSDRYDVINIDNNEYKNDKSLCQWKNDQWTHLFNTTSSYGYILKTTQTDLIFTLVDPNTSALISPYLNILYCIPYKFDSIELILVICAAILFILFLIIVGILHRLKDERQLSQYLREKYAGYTNPRIDSIQNDEHIDRN